MEKDEIIMKIMEDTRKDVKEIKDKQEEIEDFQSKLKAYVGGIVTGVSCLWAFLWYIWEGLVTWLETTLKITGN